MSRNTRAAVAAALTLYAMSLAWAGPLRPHVAEARRGGGAGLAVDGARAAAEARLVLSRQAIEVIRRPARDGALFVGRREDFYRWSRRQLGDELFLSLPEAGPRASDPEVYLTLGRGRRSPVRVAAFEDHLRRMRELESAMLPLKERRLLSTLDFLEVQSHRLEAELWLTREREEGEHAVDFPIDGGRRGESVGSNSGVHQWRRRDEPSPPSSRPRPSSSSLSRARTWPTSTSARA